MTVPIYSCDCINPPSAKEQQEPFDGEAGHYRISTTVGLFYFPDALVKKEQIEIVFPKPAYRQERMAQLSLEK